MLLLLLLLHIHSAHSLVVVVVSEVVVVSFIIVVVVGSGGGGGDGVSGGGGNGDGPLTHSLVPHCSLRSRAPLHLLARSTALTSSLTCSLFSFGLSAVKKNHLIFLFQTVELIPDWSFLSRLLILPVIGCEKVEILISCLRQIPITMAKKNPKKLYVDS